MPGEACDPIGSPTLEQSPARACGPVKRGAHAGAGLLAGLVIPWGTHAGAIHEDLHPVGGIHNGAVREGLQPLGRTHTEEVCGELSPVRGTSHWSRGRV